MPRLIHNWLNCNHCANLFFSLIEMWVIVTEWLKCDWLANGSDRDITSWSCLSMMPWYFTIVFVVFSFLAITPRIFLCFLGNCAAVVVFSFLYFVIVMLGKLDISVVWLVVQCSKCNSKFNMLKWHHKCWMMLNSRPGCCHLPKLVGNPRCMKLIWVAYIGKHETFKMVK